MPNNNEMVAESAATAAGKSKKPRAPPKKKEGAKPAPKQAANSSKSAAYPPARSMISAAIKHLKGERRSGASLSAIKKYIAANYLCGVAKFAPFLRKASKRACISKPWDRSSCRRQLSSRRRRSRSPASPLRQKGTCHRTGGGEEEGEAARQEAQEEKWQAYHHRRLRTSKRPPNPSPGPAQSNRRLRSRRKRFPRPRSSNSSSIPATPNRTEISPFTFYL